MREKSLFLITVLAVCINCMNVFASTQRFSTCTYDSNRNKKETVEIEVDEFFDLEDDGAPMEFPEGKLSIKSTIGQIYKNEAAWEFFSKMTQGKIGPDMPMWGMMENFAVEMMMGMAGNIPESAIKALNKQLNAFDVVE